MQKHIHIYTVSNVKIYQISRHRPPAPDIYLVIINLCMYIMYVNFRRRIELNCLKFLPQSKILKYLPWLGGNGCGLIKPS